MLYSKLLGKSVRAVSSQVSTKGQALLLKAGFVRESSAGRFYMLPLAERVMKRICAIIEEEMDAAGAQRISSPTLHPLHLWEETRRSESASFELLKVRDRRGAEFVLGGTAEEMMVDLVRMFDISYRDLPLNIYQFSQKFRDELRVRGGLLRTREFMMKDAYSFHHGKKDFELEYQSMADTYSRIYRRLGLDAHMVPADNGYMGGDYSHEFIVENEFGESHFFVSECGEYVAHEDVATFRLRHMNPEEGVLASEVRSAARGPSIQDGVQFYGMPAWRQIKTLLYFDEHNEPLLACLRGDLEVNECKLLKLSSRVQLRLATSEEIRALGSCEGFVSPLALDVPKYGDLSLETVNNFYTGADRFEFDTLNVNFRRDFDVTVLGDIALAKEGYENPRTGSALRSRRGIEVGNIFQLGTYYSERMKDAVFVADDGSRVPFYMGCYGIGVSRTLGAIAELHNDEKGFVWPVATAPFQTHLVVLGNDPSILEWARRVYETLKLHYSVLFDDRDVSAGIKFADADLIGIPLRLTLSRKLREGNRIEIKRRNSSELALVDADNLLAAIEEHLSKGLD